MGFQKMIDFISLRKNYELYKYEYDDAVLSAVRSGWYVLGTELQTFEKEFARMLGVKHFIGLNSGTDALIFAVKALGIGKGDEVIVSANTYIASVLGVTENGARPVYCDCKPDTRLMDAGRLKELITPRTKAIIAVHMYGNACDMDEIMSVARENNIPVIEDCAQSHGGRWQGKLTGTFGKISCFSFYPTKPLGAFGDAGGIATDDDDLADKIMLFRNYGSRVKYYNETEGRNSRLDEVQAAVLRVGLNHLTETNNIRKKIAERYISEIQNEKIAFPKIENGADSVYHLFPILVDDRKAFMVFMKEKNIGVQIHYPVPVFLADCFKGSDAALTVDEGNMLCPNTVFVSDQEVSLPIYSGMSTQDVDRVIDVINEY